MALEPASELEVTRRMFAVARGELSIDTLTAKSREVLAQANQALAGDDFEAAFDRLEEIGQEVHATLAFWERLLAAAYRLGFEGSATQRQTRLISRIRELRRHGWSVPASLGAQDENVYVFPWPGRDMAFILYDIEDLGAAGPAAGSLALLQGVVGPEVVWKSGPFVVFLDEYWLGTGRSVSFSRTGGIAFARPYLRGRFKSSSLLLVRASDDRCSILETTFDVYGIEDLGGGRVRAHCTPDFGEPLLFDMRAQDPRRPPPQVIDVKALEWFHGSDLRERVRQVQSRARD